MNAIAPSADVVRALAWPFDFRLKTRRRKETWFRFAPQNEYTVIASDRSGGVFAAARSGWITYVSAEGKAGPLAPDLTTLLAIIVELPYWRDLLKVSGGGKLDEMRRVLPYAERDATAEEPELPALRQKLRKALSLPPLADALATLHEAVTSGTYAHAVLSPEGERFGSLFGTFTLSANPLWRPLGSHRKVKKKGPAQKKKAVRKRRPA